MQVLQEEKLVENAFHLGEVLRRELRGSKSPKLKLVRGKGLMNAVVIDDSKGASAMDICLALRDSGLLAKPTHGNIIRCSLAGLTLF
jgi:ornithine--oxo-acid transaminase